MGKTSPDLIARIESGAGHKLPADFGNELHDLTLERFRRCLEALGGVNDFIQPFATLLRCITLTSSPERLRVFFGHH